MTTTKLMGAALGLLLAGAATADAAEKLTFALVPKAMNNPYFDLSRDGCMKAAKELDITCEYIGPTEHGGGEEQVQLIQDLIVRKVDGIAVSAANATAVARALKAAKDAGIPVITFDADLGENDKALRLTNVGTKNYDIGVELAKMVQAIKPKGGTICLQTGGAAAANLNDRMQGVRDTLAGKKVERLAGEGGWTEAAGCPLYCDDDIQKAVSQIDDILAAQPNLDALVPIGGWPQFAPQAYRQAINKVLPRIKDGSFALIVADTLAVQMDLLKEGYSQGQVGQRPFEMGYKAMYLLKDAKDGKKLADPTYTGLDVCTPGTADTCLKS